MPSEAIGIRAASPEQRYRARMAAAREVFARECREAAFVHQPHHEGLIEALRQLHAERLQDIRQAFWLERGRGGPRR